MTSCELSPEKKVLLASLTLEALEHILATLRQYGEVHITAIDTFRIPSLTSLVLETVLQRTE